MRITKILTSNVSGTMGDILRKKFRGCLLGGLIGDCLGASFEGDVMTPGNQKILHNYMDKLYGEYFKAPYKRYTDDTAMTLCITENLIENNGLECKELAKKFVREYYSEPDRGYGTVPQIFAKLRKDKFKNIFEPAQEQFDGNGSYGNGGAMRIAPIALFYYNDYDKMIEAAKKSTRITHAHAAGINGAILQCIAVNKCLKMDSTQKMDVFKFTDDIIENMKSIEFYDDQFDKYQQIKYQDQLKEVQKLLKTPSEAHDEKVIEILGNRVTALYSVPTAIYCFLRAQNEINKIKTDNPAWRAIHYAISLGGDTDTIGCMAGSLAGAYYGEDSFPESTRKHCEYSKELLALADTLFEKTFESEKSVKSS